MRTVVFFALVCTALAGCASSAPPSNTASSQATATAPERAKAVSHLENHIKYPATRTEILAACAQTPEFSQAEKQWFSQHLPEGSYQSATQVEQALNL